jgi:hypothetical protein
MTSWRTIGRGFVAGSALTMLVGVGTAGAQGGTTTETDAAARARAAQYDANAARDRADDLAKMGGSAYKSGLMDQANREAAQKQEEADQEAAVAAGRANWAPVAASPAVADAEEHLAALEAQGGWAYKSGAVDREKGELQALQAGTNTAPSTMELPAQVPESSRKPIELVQPAYPVEPQSP